MGMNIMLLDDPLEPSEAEAPATMAILEDPLFEIIDGQPVELPPMSLYAVIVANRISHRLDVFGQANDLGIAVTEALFKLSLPSDRNRRPDVAYVSFERWAKDRPLPFTGLAWEVVPDIAVEVVSPTDGAEEVSIKIGEYFESGVRLVWIVYPRLALVYIYESPTQVRILDQGGVLDGGNVLPGFQLALADLFPAGTA